jgi:hypothetical protein
MRPLSVLITQLKLPRTQQRHKLGQRFIGDCLGPDWPISSMRIRGREVNRGHSSRSERLCRAIADV